MLQDEKEQKYEAYRVRRSAFADLNKILSALNCETPWRTLCYSVVIKYSGSLATIYISTPRAPFKRNPIRNENAATPILIAAISKKRCLKFRSLETDR